MAILYDRERDLHERVNAALADDFKREAIENAQDVFYDKRRALVAQMPHWEGLRETARDIRDHVNANLDRYVRLFVERAEAAGVDVRLAPTGTDALCAVLDILEEHGAARVVKSKSMLTEEVGLNETLGEAGVEVTETDCGENILQTAGQPPSHIVVPALHLGRDAIAALYRDKEGYAGSSEPEEITRFLRTFLRRRFLEADVGVQGCNFAVAETGSVTLVTNEGNGRMVDSVPPVQVAVVGIDRIVPDLRSLDVFCALLARSAVGAKTTSYFTIDTGPRRAGESDGPRAVHYVLVDNRRSAVLGSDFSDILRCIRCGACLNVCPVYRHITGHGYGSIYPGPMGVVLTAALEGYDRVGDLPYACTLCGACDNDCPVMIPLHRLIRLHRTRMMEQSRAGEVETRAFRLAGKVLSNRRLYDVATRVASLGTKVLGGRGGALGPGSAWIPALASWTRTRDLPAVKRQRFRDWFEADQRKRRKTGGPGGGRKLDGPCGTADGGRGGAAGDGPDGAAGDGTKGGAR